MSNATVVVVTYSLATVTLFAVMLYLMQSINPPPLTPDDNDKVNVTYIITEGTTPVTVANTTIANSTVASTSSTASSVGYLRLTVENISRLLTTDPNNPYQVNVYPPILPPVFVTSESEIRVISVTKAVNEKNKTTESPPSHSHRRSVDTQYLTVKTTPIILKIVDEFGDSRIEIKVEPQSATRKKQRRGYRSSLKKASADYLDVTQDDEIPDNVTELVIMPNFTVVLNADNSTENAQELDSDNYLKSIVGLNSTTGTRRVTDIDEKENSSYDFRKVLALQVKIDNETKVIADTNK